MSDEIEELFRQVMVALKDVPEETRTIVCDLLRGYHEAHGKKYPPLIGETHTERIIRSLDRRGR
jgi:hypothetical protein